MSTRLPGQANYKELYELAENQAGYFTTAQARLAGFSYQQLSCYVSTQRFRRVRTGVYRLSLFPSSPNEDLFAAWLEAGSCAVVSHESALALYELSDVLPGEIHLTVPRTASRRHKGLRLHTGHLDPADVTWHEGLPVTTVPRTIADVAVGNLADELVIQAVRQAVQRGLATRESLPSVADRRGGRTRRLIRQAIDVMVVRRL